MIGGGSTAPRGRGWPWIVAACLLAPGCAREAPLARAQRLLPALGAPLPVSLGGELRSTVFFRPGQALSTRLRVPPGAALTFAFGLTAGAPGAGSAELTVTADDAVLLRETFPGARREHWWTRTVPVPAGETMLAFRAEHRGPAAAEGTMALGSPRVAPADGSTRRMVLWISQDTLRADHLGIYGYPRPTSPWLDEWGQGAVVFEQALASAPWTLPSMASQFTSRHPSAHGATRHTRTVPEWARTLFESLADEGFTVLGVAASPFFTARHGLARGFDAMVSTDEDADVVNRRVERLLREWTGGDLALFVHYLDPHAPYRPPAEFARPFLRPYEGRFDGFDFDLLQDTPEDVRRAHDLYDGEIRYNDARIRTLTETLGSRGVLDRAVVVYTSDHGEEFLEHGSWRHGGTLHEEVLRVPLLIRVPGVAHRRVTVPVSLVDVGPTVLRAVGVAPPPTFQGEDLASLMRGETPHPRPVWAETELTADRTHRVALRMGSRRYVAALKTAPDGSRVVVEDSVVDLEAPGRAGATVAVSDLRARVLEWLAAESRPPVDAGALDAETAARLRALGYLQ